MLFTAEGCSTFSESPVLETGGTWSGAWTIGRGRKYLVQIGLVTAFQLGARAGGGVICTGCHHWPERFKAVAGLTLQWASLTSLSQNSLAADSKLKPNESGRSPSAVDSAIHPLLAFGETKSR